MNSRPRKRTRSTRRPTRRVGLNPRQERLFTVTAVVVVALFLAGWAVAIDEAAAGGPLPTGLGTRLTVNPLSSSAPPEPAVLTDLAVRALGTVEPYRGESGALRVTVLDPGDTLELGDTIPPGAAVEFEPLQPGDAPPGDLDAARGDAGGTVRPEEPGIWEVLLRQGRALRVLPDFRVIATVPSGEARSGRLGRYLLGSWPARSERPARFRDAAYDPPRGLVRVTREDLDTPVSEHLTLGDLLTKGQEDVWPKYTVVSTRMLDKVELTLQELERMGQPVENVGVISAFRTPYYNEHGGSTGGRGTFSRHMYGDALDFYIDNDGDGRMDDLDGDGSVGVGDARVIARAAERVEQRHPDLVGGIGVYRPTGAHAGFVHVDTRGYRARW